MVELPLNSENRARMKKLDGPTTFAGTALLCRPLHPAQSSLRKRPRGMKP